MLKFGYFKVYEKSQNKIAVTKEIGCGNDLVSSKIGWGNELWQTICGYNDLVLSKICLGNLAGFKSWKSVVLDGRMGVW